MGLLDDLDSVTKLRRSDQSLFSDIKDFYPTGIIDLDTILGGGIPAGRIIEFWGPYSAGKTQLALTSVASFQKHCSQIPGLDYAVVWIEVETTFDKLRAAYMGVDMSRLRVFETDTIEELHLKLKEVLNKALPTNNRIFVVIDTLNSANSASMRKHSAETLEKLTKKQTKSKSDDDELYQLVLDDQNSKVADINSGGLTEKPRLIAQMLRDLQLSISATSTTVVICSQAHQKIGTYGGGMESAGGNALRHYSSVRIKVGSSKKPEQVLSDSRGAINVYKTFLSFDKNKITGVKHLECEYYVQSHRGVDYSYTLLQLAKSLGAVDVRGSWCYYEGPIADEKKAATAKWQNFKDFEKALSKFPYLELALKIDVTRSLIFVDDYAKVKLIGFLQKLESELFGEPKSFLSEVEMKLLGDIGEI